ncbi:hypothetical protein ElyMa_003814400 [Elysia marginata]|uniref:Uncharacterized protein n=1 Tax=Elysia marginata TaxID=1093978 RepID=A0AAV4FDI0_9GAST|nr:hypothetical protein ElyMa_003814400 [Elysia marginata]
MFCMSKETNFNSTAKTSVDCPLNIQSAKITSSITPLTRSRWCKSASGYAYQILDHTSPRSPTYSSNASFTFYQGPPFELPDIFGLIGQVLEFPSCAAAETSDSPGHNRAWRLSPAWFSTRLHTSRAHWTWYMRLGLSDSESDFPCNNTGRDGNT